MADNGLIVNTFDSSYNTPTQIWQLVPNISSTSSAAAGFTLYNPATGLCANNQGYSNQVILNDDPTPYGDSDYCFTMFSVGTATNGQSYLTIQDSNRNLCTNIKGGANQPDGTPIIMWGWEGNNPNNELWLITLIPTANIPQSKQ